jgi:uncharacterized protein (TIGR03437 family)
LNRFHYYLWAAAILAAIAMAPGASAQTPVNISVVSGNGQLACEACGQSFDGMYVKVTNADGSAAASVPVSWSVVGSSGSLGSNGAQTDQTFTDSNGIAVETVINLNSGASGVSFVQATVTAAIANGASVTFYETLALTSFTGAVLVGVLYESCPTCILPGEILTGSAGSNGQVLRADGTIGSQFKIQVYAQGNAPLVPNVSLRLIPNPPSQATVSCASAAGADPGSVLTNSNGEAVCTPILGPTPGPGSFLAASGGVASVGYNQGNPPQFYTEYGPFGLNVTAGAPGALPVVSGNNQSATPGQQLPLPLVAAVTDAAGNPLSGQNVVWTVGPSSSATLSGTTTTSGANGRVQTNATLTSSASGQVLVKVALASNPSISATFTITANVLITGLQVISGNNQTALVNATFAAPLVVQLNAANGPASGLLVNFAISGPAVLSSTSAITNSAGQASVQVLAGPTTGAVTVTASAGTYTAGFTLTVIPPGPALTTNSFLNGADFQQGSISPCGIATIVAPGIAPTIQGIVTNGVIGALPYTLAGVQVTFTGAQAPIYNVANMNGQQQVTVQVPCSVTPGTVTVVVSVNGGVGTIAIPVRPASPGLFLSEFNNTTQIPVLVRPDGSFVSPTNPAHRGETLIAYVTGMGATTPAVATNSLPAPGSSPAIQGTIIVGMNGGGVPLVASTLSPDLVGVETVSFMVPTTTQTGTSSFSVGIVPPGSSTPYYSNAGFFPVQ